MRFVYAKKIPPSVEKYVKKLKARGKEDAYAWPVAWSIYCKNKNPDSPSCHQEDYFVGKTTSSPDAQNRKEGSLRNLKESAVRVAAAWGRDYGYGQFTGRKEWDEGRGNFTREHQRKINEWHQELKRYERLSNRFIKLAPALIELIRARPELEEGLEKDVADVVALVTKYPQNTYLYENKQFLRVYEAVGHDELWSPEKALKAILKARPPKPAPRSTAPRSPSSGGARGGDPVDVLETLGRKMPSSRGLVEEALETLKSNRELSEDTKKAIRHNLYRAGMKPLADLFR